jgi:hypothetical protein
MPNPFATAQANAAVDPSQGQVPQGPGPSYPASDQQQPYPDPSAGTPPMHQFDEIGAIRDSILQQFPDVMAPDEPPMNLDTTQKLTMFGMFLANPSGAMDLIRERRERQAKRDRLRAELGLKATGLAGEMLKSQNEVSKGILEMHLKTNEDWRARKEMEFKEHLERGKLALQQAEAARQDRAEADKHQFNQAAMQSLSTGTDAGGSPVSTATPGVGMKRSVTLSGSGASTTYSDPSAAGGQRDPRVDFDGWLRGFIARFPGGVLPPNLSPDSSEGYDNLVQMWQKERSALAPGSFGSVTGYPSSGAAPTAPGNLPVPVRPQSGVAGYDNPQNDQIESYGR